MIGTATTFDLSATRRDLLLWRGAARAATALPDLSLAASQPNAIETETTDMSFIKTQEGTDLFYIERVRVTDRWWSFTMAGLPVLGMHGEDDQIVSYANTAPVAAKLLEKGVLKTYKGLSSGICTTHPDVINAGLLTFYQS